MEIFRQFRWQDAVDILLVAFIVYRILLLIKGTRAIQMLVGLGILLVALMVSKWINLYTIDWLVQSFWSQIVLALIILFQPELRRALAHIGENPLLYPFSHVEESRHIEEIVRTAVSLSNRKIGSLIVIERETDLKNFIEMGTELDAKVSKEILVSIFQSTSPIHDGAVIIRGKRIIAGGCFLPLSLRTDISRSLGTRHRAAIGITEETDAVVIVVSEETGAISLVIGGEITQNLDMTTLREILLDLFVRKPHRKVAR